MPDRNAIVRWLRQSALCLALHPLLVLAAPAMAAPLAITNAGFEDLYLTGNLPPVYAGDVPTGTFPTGSPPAGWTEWYEGVDPIPTNFFFGVINPGTAADFAPNPAFFDLGAPEGDNAVLLYTGGDTGGLEYGVEQTLVDVLEPYTDYTLTVEVGNIGSGTALLPPYSGSGFFNIDGFPGYRIQLLAGGEMIAEDVDTVAPGEREWATATLQLTTTDAHLHMGEPLGVRVVNRNQPDVVGVTGIEVDFDDVRLDATPTPPVPVGTPIALVLALIAAALATLRRPVHASR